MRKLFFDAYILPHLDYCCNVWGNCNVYLEDKIIRFQKRAARLILDKDFNTPSSELFSALKWMTFPVRVKYQKALLMFKILNGQAPLYLQESFRLTSDVRVQNLRSSSSLQLYIPKPKSELFRKTLVYSGSTVWNSLPFYIKNANSVHHFKSLYIRWSKDQ